MNIKIRRIIAIFLISIFVTNGAFATCPLTDVIEYKGERYGLAKWTNPPKNEKVFDWIRKMSPCTAIGQGRGFYQVQNDQIVLVKFFGCGSELSVHEAFSQSSLPMTATWLNGKIDVARGNCHGGWDPATEYFMVDNGRLIEFHKEK